jgi:hypothetical protein
MVLEQVAITRLDVAEIGAAFIGAGVGDLLHVAILGRLVRELRQEGGNALGRVDRRRRERRVDVGQVRVERRLRGFQSSLEQSSYEAESNPPESC